MRIPSGTSGNQVRKTPAPGKGAGLSGSSVQQAKAHAEPHGTSQPAAAPAVQAPLSAEAKAWLQQPPKVQAHAAPGLASGIRHQRVSAGLTPLPVAAAAAAGPAPITPATIGARLDAIQIQTRTQTTSEPVPNSVGLNDIASRNTPSKRAAFVPLQRAHKKKQILAARLKQQKSVVQKRETVVQKRQTQALTSAHRVAGAREWVRTATLAVKDAKTPADRREARQELGKARRSLTGERRTHRVLKRKLTRSQNLLTRSQKALAKTERDIAHNDGQITRLSEGLRRFVRDHGIAHNTVYRNLGRQLRNAENKLARLKGQNAPADQVQQAETAVEWLSQQRLHQHSYLQSAIQSFEPMARAEKNLHRLRVDGVRVSLSDNVITYATDNPKGLDGGAHQGDSRALVNQRINATQLSTDRKAILRRVSNNEGTFSKMNTWDRAKVTFGFVQWTTGARGNGSLVGLMTRMRRSQPAAFRRRFQAYGIDVERGRLKVTQADGQVLRGAAAADAVRIDPKLVAVFSAAGTDPALQRVQIAEANRAKISAMVGSALQVGNAPLRIGQIVSSEYGVALMADRAVHTGEGGTRRAIRRAVAAFLHANPTADLNQPAWAARAGAHAVRALESIDPARARRFADFDRTHGSFD